MKPRRILLVVSALLALGASALYLRSTPIGAVEPQPAELTEPIKIPARDSVFIEELTWVEVRDAIAGGKTTAIIATGGVEQAGPYLATGKHNLILRVMTERIARSLGDALVAPIVPFVPEGNIDPKTGHMRYSGTISVRAETFEALLTDAAESLAAHGFKDIVLIGDSGGNRNGMQAVTVQLSEKWSGGETAIHYVPEYYNYPRLQEWLKDQGIDQVPGEYHDDLATTLLIYLNDPKHVRMKTRIEAGQWQVNGVELGEIEDLDALANALADAHAEVALKAIRDRVGE